jgi:hypothetical protein
LAHAAIYFKHQCGKSVKVKRFYERKNGERYENRFYERENAERIDAFDIEIGKLLMIPQLQAGAQLGPSNRKYYIKDIKDCCKNATPYYQNQS